MARREEWQEQKRLARLLDTWLPDCATWTATDPTAASALSGAIRKQRGVKPGVPDVLVWYHGKSIAIEMKSPGGRCTASQRAVRESLLRAGCRWFECRSANAAMVAIAACGLRFRRIVREDGSVECWQKPQLADWEKPRSDPREARPLRPEVAAERRAARQRWRERQRHFANLAPECHAVRKGS
jgi:hypothetical protein